MTRQNLLLILSLICFSGVLNSQNTYNEVSLPELMKKKQQDPNLIILDVRTNGEFYDTATRYKQGNIGRIKGARHIELQELERNPDAVKQLDALKDKEIYVICSHSYRSRSISNLLLKNGFTHVNNVRGGMTEWFRRYEELAPYRKDFYETSNHYRNISSAELYSQLAAGEQPLLIGITNTPKFFYDSLNIDFYTYYPSFKNALYFNYADSLKLWETVQQQPGKPVILFNMVNTGAAELTEWLTGKGVKGAAYLVGNSYYFYDYVLNKNLANKSSGFIATHSAIQFISAINLCPSLKKKNELVLVDVRHDTLFNKVNSGMKEDYTHLGGSVNFFFGKGESAFMQAFPDKKKGYVFISEMGITGLAFADALTKKGYTIYWLNGGIQRWDWHRNNIENFPCTDLLLK